MLKDFDLTDRRVLITGAGRGIGKGIALAMAEAGADVGVTSLGGETAERVADEVTKLGRRGYGWAADGTKVAPMEALRDKALAALGGVDILINCFGDSIRGSIAAMPGVEGRLPRAALTSGEAYPLHLRTAYTGRRGAFIGSSI